MKLTVHIDREREEEVLIYAHERHGLVASIERLLAQESDPLIGYDGREAVRLHPQAVSCFVVEDDRVYALTDGQRLQMKCRLYQLEERLGEDFVKVNQSCLANIHRIQRFDASVSGVLTVTFCCGYREYVSRRQLKHVKERLGV